MSLTALETRRKALTAPPHLMNFNSLSIILSHLSSIALDVHRADRIGMEAVPSNEGIDGVKTGVTEKSYPKVEIADIAICSVQFTAGFVHKLLRQKVDSC
jgi:hypothetical protein